jgi:hypothetical protein
MNRKRSVSDNSAGKLVKPDIVLQTLRNKKIIDIEDWNGSYKENSLVQRLYLTPLIHIFLKATSWYLPAFLSKQTSQIILFSSSKDDNRLEVGPQKLPYTLEDFPSEKLIIHSGPLGGMLFLPASTKSYHTGSRHSKYADYGLIRCHAEGWSNDSTWSKDKTEKSTV